MTRVCRVQPRFPCCVQFGLASQTGGWARGPTVARFCLGWDWSVPISHRVSDIHNGTLSPALVSPRSPFLKSFSSSLFIEIKRETLFSV